MILVLMYLTAGVLMSAAGGMLFSVTQKRVPDYVFGTLFCAIGAFFLGYAIRVLLS